MPAVPSSRKAPPVAALPSSRSRSKKEAAPPPTKRETVRAATREPEKSGPVSRSRTAAPPSASTPAEVKHDAVGVREASEEGDIGADLGSLSPTEVFDEADHAQWLNLRELADIQRRARALNAPESHPEFNGTDCVTCGEIIPLARRELKKVRCVDCQGLLEDSRRRHSLVGSAS